MSAPGKWDTHQQLRSKALASKEASKIISKPLKEEPKPIVLEKVETPVEAKLEPLVEVVTESEIPAEIVELEVEEAKVELKPISKKKNKE